MNDFPLIGDLCNVETTLGSPGGKHMNSLLRNVWRKIACASKAFILEKKHRIFTVNL